MFNREKPAPVGANVPDAHAASFVPAVSIVGGPAADELPDAINYSPRTVRSYRGREEFGALQGPAYDTPDAQLRGEHAHTGPIDPRAVWGAAMPAGALFTAPPAVELRQLDPAAAVVEDAQAAPTRNRAGSTGEDTARASTFSSYLFVRPFDQSAEYGPTSVDKLPMTSPLAAHPIRDTAGVPGGLPSPSGDGPAAGMEAIGTRMNTFRTIPGNWDDQLVANAGAAVSDAAARNSGWRLR